MKKTAPIILSFVLTSLLANNNDYARQRAGISEDVDGLKTVEVVKQNKELQNNDKQDNEFAVIYNHIQTYETRHEKDAVMIQATTFGTNAPLNNYNHDFYAQAQKELKNIQAKKEQEQSDLKKHVSLFTNGYCVLKNKITIGRLAGYADLNCDLSVNKNVTLKVALTPDFYTYSLIATPLYALINSKRFPIVGGAVQNGLRTSLNVASRVDDYLISRIIADTGVKTSPIVTQYAQAYIEEKKSFRQAQNNNRDTSVIINGNTTILDTNTSNSSNTLPPNYKDYLGGAVVDVVSTLISSIGNAYLQTRTFTFEIDKDTILYADVEFDMTKEELRGLNFVPPNFIIQQPSTDFSSADTTGKINFHDVGVGNLQYRDSINRQQERSFNEKPVNNNFTPYIPPSAMKNYRNRIDMRTK